ncbi:MAG: HAD family hydrolase [Bryobacteraceae bacterium]
MGVGPVEAVKRAVFLDRDGVINRAVVREGKPYPPASLVEMELNEGVRDGLRSLRAEGYKLLVVTNQPDVARGTQSREAIERMHEWLGEELPIDDFFVCYHDSGDGCACRKPRPGLLHQGAEKYGIDLGSSYVIGDRWRDVDAGAAAGCRTVWIDYGYQERGPTEPPDARVASVRQAVEWILSQGAKTSE